MLYCWQLENDNKSRKLPVVKIGQFCGFVFLNSYVKNFT